MRIEPNCSSGVVNRKNSETQKNSLRGVARSGSMNPCASTIPVANATYTVGIQALFQPKADSAYPPAMHSPSGRVLRSTKRVAALRTDCVFSVAGDLGAVRNTHVSRQVWCCSLANGAVTIPPGDVTQGRPEVERQTCQQYQTGYLDTRQVEGLTEDPEALEGGAGSSGLPSRDRGVAVPLGVVAVH